MEAAQVDTTYVGSDLAIACHNRTLRMFANIAAITEPEDRIITIFGAGHMSYLRPLVEASPRTRQANPLDYL